MWGEIHLNNERVGEMHAAGATSSVHWYSESLSNLLLRDGDVLEFIIKVPFMYIKSFTVKRKELDISKEHSLSGILKKIKEVGFFNTNNVSAAKSFKQLLTTINTYFATGKKHVQDTSVVGSVKLARDFTENKLQFDAIETTSIYKNLPAMMAAITAAGTAQPGRIFIEPASKVVYGYLNGSYQQIRISNPKDIFGAPRVVKSTAGGEEINYLFGLDNSITVI